MAITLNGTTNVITPTTAVQPTGGILQVVEGTTQSRVTIDSGTGSWVDTNLSCSITPSATSSKVLVMVNGTLFTGSTSSAAATIFRGGTGGTNIGNATRGLYTGNNGIEGVMGCNMIKLDSPSTTSATEYLVKIMRVWAGAGGDTMFPSANSSEIASIVLMEIAG
tara:strand:+ start:456 stop:950 length:495 start_codon:yes stop_codon:yes gene_type:complete